MPQNPEHPASIPVAGKRVWVGRRVPILQHTRCSSSWGVVRAINFQKSIIDVVQCEQCGEAGVGPDTQAFVEL